MNIQEGNFAHYFRVQSEREQTLILVQYYYCVRPRKAKKVPSAITMYKKTIRLVEEQS